MGVPCPCVHVGASSVAVLEGVAPEVASALPSSMLRLGGTGMAAPTTPKVPRWENCENPPAKCERDGVFLSALPNFNGSQALP